MTIDDKDMINSILESVSRIDYIKPEDIPNIDLYMELDPFIQEKILNQILEEIYHDDLILINDRHVELIHNLINSKKKNTYIYLPNSVKVIKEYSRLIFKRDVNEVDDYDMEFIDYAILPNGKHLEKVTSCDTNGNDICRLDSSDINLPLYVRTRKYGDKMFLKGTNGHKKVKDIFIDAKVPMSDRELWPIVVDATGEIVWIPGIKKSKFNKQKNEKCDIIVKYY